jgi:glutathione peroxidase
MAKLRDFISTLAVSAGIAKPGVEADAAPVNWAGLPLPSIEGGQIDPESLRGKVVLVVNTASACGFTGQYAGLQQLHDRFHDRGLVVVGVPSNDFGGQDPKPNADIQQFCQVRFGVTFPLLAKQVVSGDGAHPFYRWAKDASGPGGAPAWNFHKYLIGRDGRLIAWYPSMVGPTSSRLIDAIEAALSR